MIPRALTRSDVATPGRRLLLHLLVCSLFCGCASPQLQEPSTGTGRARLEVEAAIMADGYCLPVRRWGNPEHPQALVLALHGFNDYSNAFANLGPYLATHGILTYSYDQRGFGNTAQRGRWAGGARMIADLQMLTRLLRERYPETPLFLLGESMGGAEIMAAAALDDRADGIVLVAPAVWSRDTMSPIQNLVLKVAVHTVPWLELTGTGIEIRPSDNLDMLHAYSADPLVIKGTRVDALWGVTNVMDRAMAQAAELLEPALLLYGEHDQIIPKDAFCTLLDRIPADNQGIRILLYRNGWHMLTRDLQGERVMEDIAAWLTDRNAPLPSGEEVQVGSHRLENFCRD
jgi:acylglycerol lipase